MDDTSPQQETGRRRNRSRWRAGTLIAVYVLMALHLAHWKLTGRTLAPLELNEVMHTLELGIVTAGFVFMSVALLSVLLFGRFFCSWGCHILALEDLCVWLLEKVNVRPKPIRSRALLLVPPGALLYMFVWPQVSRVLAGEPLPELRVASGDGEAWASFVTSDFLRNLPGPGVALITFAICGFLIVYVLGSRSFCRYGCPYGALFGLVDKVAPGRIVAAGGCDGCGKCTATCQSDVRVHEELAAFGTVVNSACLKDLDCVDVCPNGAIAYGLTRPPLLRLGQKPAAPRPRTRFDFTWPEELFAAAVFLASLAIFRGLYGYGPFLLALGIGGILAYVSVVGLRLVTRESVKTGGRVLRTGGRLTSGGRTFVALAVLAAAFVAHSGFVRYHEFLGARAYVRAIHTGGGEPETAQARAAIEHLESAARWGLVEPLGTRSRLARLWQCLGSAHASSGRHAQAVAAYRSALAFRPDGSTHMALGELLAGSGQLPEATGHFVAAVELDPASAPARYNLAVLLASQGRRAEALEQYREAALLDPSDPEIHNNLGFLLMAEGDVVGAETAFRRAIQLRPEYAQPYFNLGRLLGGMGRSEDAAHWFREAGKRDAAIAQAIREGVIPEAR